MLDKAMRMLPESIPPALRERMLNAASVNAHNVMLYRQYASGIPRPYLSAKERRQLRLPRDGHDLNVDYLNLALDTLRDRLVVQSIRADNDAAQEWVGEVLERINFRRLQRQLHKMAILYGDAFLVGRWDDEGERATLSLHAPYDSKYGIVPLYDLADVNKMQAALNFTIGDEKDQIVVYLYQSDRVDSLGQNGYTEVGEWSATTLPIAGFRYDHDGISPYGQSDARGIVNLQDAFNRNLASMLIAGALSAFPIIFSKGVPEKARSGSIEPGAWVAVEGDDAPLLNAADMKSIPPGSQQEFIGAGHFIVQTMMDTTRVPIVSRMATQLSGAGEAMKQLEAGMLSKVETAQDEFGAGWTDALRMVHAIETAHAPAGSKPPPLGKLSVSWRKGEMRSDEVVTSMAQSDFNVLSDRALYVETVASARHWDGFEQKQIIERSEEAERKRLALMTGLDDG